MTNQTDLFGAAPIRCEYYPVLLPDEEGMAGIAVLNQILVEQGVKPSQLTKLPHISIDGVVCPENDEKVTNDITTFLATQGALPIEFSQLGHYPGRGGVTLKIGIQNDEVIKEFNKNFMEAIQGKVTKLDLHLTLARYVNAEVLERVRQMDIVLHNCSCKSVAIYKKEFKSKGAYEVIGRVGFGLDQH
jgi:hypothetical protein